MGDVVWAKEHNLSKAAEEFAAKLAPRYDGPYQFVDFVSPVFCKIRHIHTKKKRTVQVGELKQQLTDADPVRKETGLCARPNRESSISHAEGINTRILH